MILWMIRTFMIIKYWNPDGWIVSYHPFVAKYIRWRGGYGWSEHPDRTPDVIIWRHPIFGSSRGPCWVGVVLNDAHPKKERLT